MPTSPDRVAANRANARKSTGPKTPEGKARSSQNARKHSFNPDPFTIVRIEDRAQIADLVADAIATYQPINSQERHTVERIALAQHSMRRMSALEAGFFTNCLDQGPMDQEILDHSDRGKGVEIATDQHRAYGLAFGFNRYTRQSNVAATFLRFQAQAERLYRHAVEDFHRLLKLRSQLPPEKYEEPIEPNIEPNLTPEPTENTAHPTSAPPNSPENEPAAEPDAPADLSSLIGVHRRSSAANNASPRCRQGCSTLLNPSPPFLLRPIQHNPHPTRLHRLPGIVGAVRRQLPITVSAFAAASPGRHRPPSKPP
jgi:hypothetical protein